MRTNVRFTAAEDATILQLRAAGRLWREIANALRRPNSSVANRGRRLGVQCVTPAATDAPTQHQHGVFSPAEDAFILRSKAAGATNTEIATALSCSPSTIANRVRLIAPPGAQPVAPSQAVPAAPRPQVAPLGGEVRCLGGCGGRFHSPDRLRIRICPRCKADANRCALPEAYAVGC